MTFAKRKALRKKEQILRSAIKMVNERGFDGATMEDIASELEMTKGSLYYYFKNKSDLLYQCHHFVLSQAIEEHEQHLLATLAADELIRRMIATHIEYAVEKKELFNMIIEPRRTFNDGQLESVLRMRKKYASLFDEAIRRGIASKQFQNVEVMIVRMLILGALNWVQQWYHPEGHYSKEELQQQFGNYILKMLT